MSVKTPTESCPSRLSRVLRLDLEEEDLKHEENMEEDLQPANCMVHALVGYVNPQAMKIRGFLKKQPVTILINTGSTNNFMDNKVAAQSMHQIEDCSTSDVKVADG
ncbi:hypothetical protein GW17_00036441 [Ensete ventricosum]|nr:hypothetical protein GW17_00036441 [Ensete ventricosum]